MIGRRRRTIDVVLYTRHGCGLCRDAEALLRKLHARTQVTLVDIEHDDALLKQYALRIPVLSVNGVDVAEGRITADELRQALAAATPPSTPGVSRWRFWA